MSLKEIAERYASALHGLTKEKGSQEQALFELRKVADIIHADEATNGFIHSPLIIASEKEAAVRKAFSGKGLSPEVESFVLLLAKKNRIAYFEKILDAYQDQLDRENGVTRGTVKSVNVLSPEERSEIEERVSKATGKRVILNYTEDPNLIGGLIAQVGGYTFDDTLITHVGRLKDELNRRTH